MVGGYENIDVNDEGAQNALNFAVVEHNKRSNNMFLSQVAEVVGVERQPYQCEFTVLVVPWRNETKMLGQKC
ncbi:hypothetical protein JOQ06_021142 [Pogonophryne albipinna]|uniref:Cystatin domain-containing protein n=1 Tax=Pogonophryne albipinna TaxID=1090488 RepID=A0AAD6BUH9_9TELE|nr:hypothetical protein JOQ06_021142 [Pogonophryne albipinna]